MKKTNTKETMKRRIIAVGLSAITITSFATTTIMSASAATNPSAVSYSSSASTVNGTAKKSAYSAITSGLSTAISVLSKSNPFTAIIANSLIGGLKTIYESDPSAPTTQDIMDTLKEIADSIKVNHETEMNEINRAFLESNIEQCLDNYRVIKGANKDVIAALLAIDDIDNCSLDFCKKIVKMTNGYSDYSAAFDKMSSYFSPDGTSKDTLLDKYMNYMKKKTNDASVIKENAEQFTNLVTGHYLLAYVFKITGYAAEIRKTKLQNKILPGDTEEVKADKEKAIKEITKSNQAIVASMTETDLKPALDEAEKFLDSLNSLDSASIIIDGKETHCYSIVDAWVLAVKSNGQATVKLNKDIIVNDFESLSHNSVNVSDYFKNGALYLENQNSEITLDLNGHTLLNKKGEAINVNNCTSFKVTSSAENKGTLGGLRAEGNSKNKMAVEISNAVISGGSNSGIYANHAVKNLTVNNCIIKGYTDSGVKLYNNDYNRYAEINNSLFENNSAVKGGAINNGSFDLSVNNCQFVNNQSTGNGGAVYYE